MSHVLQKDRSEMSSFVRQCRSFLGHKIKVCVNWRMGLNLSWLAFVFFLTWSPGFAQVTPLDSEDDANVAEDAEWDISQRLGTVRKIIVTLQSLNRRLQTEDNSGVADDFQRLRTADAFSLVPSQQDPGVFVPLHRALFAAVFDLPDIVRENFKRTSGLAAENSLEEALADGKASALLRLISEFAGTDASIKAHFALARLHLNRGNVLAAKNWLRPVLHENIAETFRASAQQILDDLDQVNSNVKPAAGVQAVTAPRHLVWQSRPAASPKLRAQIDVFQKAAGEAKIVPQTSWQVVFDNQAAYRRTLRGLAAVDLTTGGTIWEYPIGVGLDASLSSNRANNSVFGVASGELAAGFARMEHSPLVDTFCRDNLLSGLESDAGSIYTVVTDGKDQSSNVVSRGFRGPTSNGFLGNRLIAIRKESGSRVWSFGKTTIEEHLGASSVDCWIAGPPVAHGRDLYCVFEWNSEILLGCISAGSGELLWTTVLAYPEQSIEKDAVRRLWGASPMRSGGHIWCHTTSGWLVCVDELSHAVVCATAIQTENTSENAVPVGRGQPVVFTRSASLADRWSASRLIAVGDVLVTLAHESHDIVLVDQNSGRVIRRIAVERGAVLVHVDSQYLVTGSNRQLECIDTKSGEIRWAHPLVSTEGAVTGHGVRRGRQLLVPMSTGAIATVDLDSGKFADSVASVLPRLGWGNLISPEELDGDIAYMAPDRMVRLSVTQPEVTPQDPVEVASGLMAAGKWEAALELAASVPKADATRREAESVIFQCRLQLAAAQPEKHLKGLVGNSLGVSREVSVKVLEASVSLKQQRFDAAAGQLVEILGLGPAVLSLPIPQIILDRQVTSGDENSSKSNSFAGVRSRISLPLLTWSASRLRECLNEITMTAEFSESLRQVSDSVLLSIRHPALRPILLRRIRETQSDEAALHLLRHSLGLLLKTGANAPDDLRPEAQLLAARFQKVLTEDSADAMESASNQALRQLLVAIRLELPEAVVAAMQVSQLDEGGLSVMDTDIVDLRDNLTTRFSEWRNRPYTAVPITRLSSTFRNFGMLTTSELDDPFLRQYRWSAIHGEYGRVLAESVSMPDRQWSVPGNFEAFGTYSNRTDILQRIGSVLVLQTYRSISAISVLDGKLLWTKPISSQSGVTTYVSQRNSFSSFVAGRNYLPSWQAMSPYRIVGSGTRWLCVRHGLQLEVVDLYSGQTSWSAELPGSQCHVIATDDVVIVRSKPDAEVVCFDRRDGEVVSISGADRLADTAIRNVASRFVCWNQSQDETPHSIIWVHPVTQQTEMEVSLADMKQFHFLDDRTLIGINAQQEFLVVDLVNGSVQRCSYRIGGKDTPEEIANYPEEHNGPPDLPLWEPARLQVTADALNYYVSNRGSNNSSSRQPFGRQMTRFEGGLRAINRSTGNIRWWIDNDTSLLASTDQPELAVLVLVNDSLANAVGGNSAVSENVFRGISKLTGDELFRQSIPSQYGVRYVSMHSPAPNVLDIGVQGMRVRMKAEIAETTPDSR